MEEDPTPSPPVGDPGQPTVAPELDILDETEQDDVDRLAPAEAFQTLANEVRVAVLIRLYTAERDDEPPLSFSDLQQAAGSGSSAGFAYHLRQLRTHFISHTEDGYVLTPAGRRTAEAIISGTFTDGSSPSTAS